MPESKARPADDSHVDGQDERPSDLLLQADAAEIVGKSVSTIRSWLRTERLTKYREEPGNERSRVLVSRAELLTVARQTDDGQPLPAVARPADDSQPAVKVTVNGAMEAMQATVNAQQETIGVLQAALAQLNAAASDKRESADAVSEALSKAAASAAARADAEKSRAEDLKIQLERALETIERLQAEQSGLAAELDAMRAASGRSWWHRLLSG